MKKERLINIMFDELENNGKINHNKNKEYIKYSKYQQKIGEDLYNFIDKNIVSNTFKAELRKQIDLYIDSCLDTCYSEFKTYYRYGFIDGVDFARD